eukprot:TRINITY_DN18179_c0_g2_i1.p1 TRINITY_DN18179_c0_g2~~TRINITY_DN18179_c0_g2_i1.p1  ORF type:complete len:118 (+),score=20.46 TRINITY_DN18179_c0_g2_i1:49-354(+)
MAAFKNTHVSIKVLAPAAPGEDGKYYWGMVSQPACKDLFQIEATSGTTVGQLKASIATQKGYPAEKQRLIFFGKPLDNVRDLASCGFENTDEPLLHLIPNP